MGDKYGIRQLKKTNVLCILAALTALNIVLSRALRVDLGFARFSFGSVCTIMAGLWFGPVAGAAEGFAADLLGTLLQGNAPNPLIMIAAILWGVIPAFFLRRSTGTRGNKIAMLSLGVTVSSLVCTIGFTTAGLVLMLGYDFRAIFPTRCFQFLVMTPVYCVLVCCLYFSPVTTYLRRTVTIYEPAAKSRA